MTVTEEEAKTKRCQESFGDGWTTTDGRMATLVGAPHGAAVVASPSHCIGSACMAWRWIRERDPNYSTIGPETPEGYCGKAGKL